MPCCMERTSSRRVNTSPTAVHIASSSATQPAEDRAYLPSTKEAMQLAGNSACTVAAMPLITFSLKKYLRSSPKSSCFMPSSNAQYTAISAAVISVTTTKFKTYLRRRISRR